MSTQNIIALARHRGEWVAVGRVPASVLVDASIPAEGTIGIYTAGGGTGGLVVCLEVPADH